MQAIFVNSGTTIDYRPTQHVPAGQVVVVNGLVAISKSAIPAGTLGTLAITGMFDVRKDTSALALGQPVYWDQTNQRATSTATDNTLMGRAAAAAATADPTVRVILLP